MDDSLKQRHSITPKEREPECWMRQDKAGELRNPSTIPYATSPSSFGIEHEGHAEMDQAAFKALYRIFYASGEDQRESSTISSPTGLWSTGKAISLKK